MGAAYNPAVWSTFFSAQAGASAALAGLIFVAVSINLPKIIVARALVARAAKALFALMGVLLAASLGLMPGQPVKALGCELAALGAAVWIATTLTQYSAAHRNPYIGRWQKVFHFGMTQCAALPIVAAGGLLIVSRGGGLYWLAAGMMFCYVEALLDAWVLLVEILR
jgi:modulator of FtsH protease